MIKKETFKKYASIEMADCADIIKDITGSEVIEAIVDNFNLLLDMAEVLPKNRALLIENLATNLILVERLARREEREK